MLSYRTSKIQKKSYTHLSILKILKRYTSQFVRKQLAKAFQEYTTVTICYTDLRQFQLQRIIKLQKSCAIFVKRKLCFAEDVVLLKWLLIPERIDFTVSKTTFKGLLNDKIHSNFQINKKKRKQGLREPAKIIKLTPTGEPNYEPNFFKYATTLYNQAPKQI